MNIRSRELFDRVMLTICVLVIIAEIICAGVFFDLVVKPSHDAVKAVPR